MSKKNSILSLVLIFAIVFVIFPYQPASAQAREITSYCYLNVEPNPGGSGSDNIYFTLGRCSTTIRRL